MTHQATMTLLKLGITATTILSLAGLASPAYAMTTMEVPMICPYDGTAFSAKIEVSGYMSGATLDLKPVGSITSPWPLAICPTNGFVFYKRKFSDQELEKLQPFVLSDEYRAMHDESPYYRAAWLKEHAGATHWDVTWTLVQANWERHIYATKVAERLPQDIAESDGDMKIQRSLLYGDFLRQLGRFPEAEQVFTGLREKFDRFSPYGMVTHFELTLVQAKDASNQHLQIEATKMAESDPEYKRVSKTPVLTQAGPLRQSFILEPEGLNIAQNFKRLFWSEDSGTLYTSSNEGVLAINAATGTLTRSPQLSCTGCKFAITELLLSSGTSLWAYNWNGSASGYRSPTPGSLKMLDAKTLGVTASYEVRDLQNPALLSYDKNALIYKLGLGFELRNIASNETQALTLPSGQVMGAGRTFASNIKAAAPTGPQLALSLGALDKTRMIIWDYAVGTQVQELDNGGRDKLFSNTEAAFSADGKYIYLSNYIAANTETAKDQQCELGQWDTQSGHMLASQQMPGENGRVALSFDGRYAALACGQTISLWTANLAQRVATISISGKGWFPSIAFSPDSKKFAVHVGESVAIYDLVK